MEMRDFGLSVLILCTLLVVNAGAQSGRVQVTPSPTPTPSDDQDLRVETEEIKVNISAFDTDGKFFPGVRVEDLVINEDNVLNQATSVRRTPANVLIVLDTGGEDRIAKDYKTTRETAKALIQNLQPDDSVALLEFNDTARIIAEWTTDKNQLYSVLDRQLRFGKRARFIEALNLAVNFLEKAGSENRHLVLITDGTDSVAKESERKAAFMRVLATDINVHVFSYTGLEQAVVKDRKKSMVRPGGSQRAQLPPGAEIPVRGQTTTYPTVTINTDREMMKRNKERGEQLSKSEKELNELSEDTNGILFLPATSDEMIEKSAALAHNIDSQYVVTYTPKRPLAVSRKGEIRSIIVTSKRDGLEVIGRRKLAVTSNP